MPPKLEDIHFAIGALTEGFKGVKRSLDEDRRASTSRHGENKRKLSSIEGRLTLLETKLTDTVKVVNKIEPIVDGIVIARWKRAGAVMVLTVIMGLLGWLVGQLGGRLVTWLLAHLPHLPTR